MNRLYIWFLVVFMVMVGVNATPSISNVYLNSSFGTNKSIENLTVSFSQVDSITNNTDWRINGQSMAVLNMPFEPDGSQNASDFSTYNNDGTVILPVGSLEYTNGYKGKAYRYALPNGNHIRLSNSATLYPTNTMTVMAWVNHSNAAMAVSEFILSKNRPILTTPIFLRIDTTGKLNFGGENVGSTTEAVSTSTLNDNLYHHVAGRYNGTHYQVFVDGVLEASTVATRIADNGCDVIIGGLAVICTGATTTGNRFNGVIDEVRMFNRSLSNEQILLYAQNKENIISYQETTIGESWTASITPFNETTGSSVLSNTVTIIDNNPPVVSNLFINSSYGTNTTSENITGYWTSSDSDFNSIFNITDWRIGGTSIALLNLPFEAGSSNTSFTKDYSTYGNNGAVTGADFLPTGGYNGGGAYRFNGTDSIIQTGNLGAINNVSITMWVKRNTIGTNRQYFFGTEQVGGGYIFAYFTEPGHPNPNSLELAFHTSAVDYRYRYTDITITDSNWHHISLQRTGVNSEIWIDGINRSLTTELSVGTPSGTINTNSQYVIGARYDGLPVYNGSLDNIVVYNRFLSPSQIGLLYQNKSNIIASQELMPGQTWSLAVTPNDGIVDGSTAISNGLTIQGPIPPPPANVTIRPCVQRQTTTKGVLINGCDRAFGVVIGI